jgi:hypothetical protein
MICIDRTKFLQYYNSIIRIALVIFNQLLSINRITKLESMGLYHPLDGVTNLKYKLLYFLTPNTKKFKEKGTSF